MYRVRYELECGPMPNVMAAQPNIGGALCESSVIPFLVRYKEWNYGTFAEGSCTPQTLADARCWSAVQ